MPSTPYISPKKQCLQDCKNSDKLSTEEKRECKQKCRDDHKGEDLFNWWLKKAPDSCLWYPSTVHNEEIEEVVVYISLFAC